MRSQATRSISPSGKGIAAVRNDDAVDRDAWDHADRSEQVLAPGAALVVDPVGRLQALLDELAGAFADAQFGTRMGIDLRLGRRGLLADESASFLRAFDAGLLVLDETGGVRVKGCRPKPGGGRYSLFSANRYGGDFYVSLNLEYLIQLGATCELVAFHGWPGADVEVEVGEFDALAHGIDRAVLAMEAKARIDGPDSLTSLWHSLLRFASSDVPPEPLDNHSRKYVELLRLTDAGSVVLWLVAAQARWSVLSTRVSSHLEFEFFEAVTRRQVLDVAASRVVGRAQGQVPVVANLGHALDTARLTELDGQQRCYEFPWRDEHELDVFIATFSDRAHAAGITHARAWKWRAEQSMGSALSPSGRTTGLELRVSYYAD